MCEGGMSVVLTTEEVRWLAELWRPPIKASYLPWTCAWCGETNAHFGVVCERCHHYGQPPNEPTGHRCFWGYGKRTRRCKQEAVRAVDTATTRGYYCEEHAEVAERLLSGGGR